MFADNETAIARVLGQVADLNQSLRGYGVPRVTPAAQVDGKSLSDALRALQSTIDDFLSGKL
jgi:predicted component of type VI protein secretion system